LERKGGELEENENEKCRMSSAARHTVTHKWERVCSWGREYFGQSVEGIESSGGKLRRFSVIFTYKVQIH